MDDLDVYLDVLFGDLDGFVYSPVKTLAGSFEPTWFQYPKEREQLKTHIQAADRGDIYISPAVYNERRAQKESIKKIQCAWVEFDGAERIDFKDVGEPTAIVQTSYDSHCHCYWRLTSTHQTSIEDINRRLTFYLNADSSGWDAVQLLRPPGTTNYKRNLPVVLSNYNTNAYAVGYFDFVPAVQAPASTTVVVTDLMPISEVLANHQLPLKVLKMIKKEKPVEPHRSSFLARLANELAEEGLTHIEVVSLLKVADGRIKKYEGRDDQLTRLSQIADYAIFKHVADEEIEVLDFEFILNHVDNLQWIIPNWLHTTGMMFVSSAPNVGKTQLCFQLAACLAEGWRWLGFEPTVKQRVLFLSLEMTREPIKYVIEHHQHEWETMPKVHVVDEESTLTKYEDIIDQREINVVIIDSLSELLDINSDNKELEARRVLKWMKKCRRRYGIAFIIIHHNRKATEGNKKPKSLHDLEGTFHIGRTSDTVLQLWEDSRGIELSAVKARFGVKQAFYVERNKNLWFKRKDASNESKPTRTDTPGNVPEQPSSNRHRDDVDKSARRAFSFRVGDKD